MRLTLGSLRRNLTVFGLFIVFYVGFGAWLSLNQESIVYQPFAQDFEDCPALADAEKIASEGTRMYYKDNGPILMLVYHGNAGSACDRAFLAMLAEEAGYSYLLPEYAGYSDDAQKPSHDRIKRDVEHVSAFIESRDFQDVVIFGESIGTGAASYHASLRPEGRLLLVSPFTDLVGIARKRFWFYPSSLLVDNAFDNRKLLSGYDGQVLILHGDKDDIIPLSLGKALYDTLPTEKKRMLVIPGAGHNTMYESADMYGAIRDFLRSGLEGVRSER